MIKSREKSHVLVFFPLSKKAARRGKPTMTNKNDPFVLGISASPHNGSVCLLKGDESVVAIQEERLIRRKRAPLYGARPSLAIEYCLDYAGIRPSDLNMIVCCVTTHAKTPDQDVTLNPILQPKRYN